jgi:hypothetical protein
MDDIPLCPDWWPHMLWQLHFPHHHLVPHIPDPVGPVNYPPEINRLLLALVTYASSYHLSEELGMKQRETAKAEVVEAANSLNVRRA